MSTPFSVILPSVGSYRRVSSFTSVVFPEPFSPTSPTLSLGLSSKFMFFSTVFSVFGYANETFSNRIIGCEKSISLCGSALLA